MLSTIIISLVMILEDDLWVYLVRLLKVVRLMSGKFGMAKLFH